MGGIIGGGSEWLYVEAILSEIQSYIVRYDLYIEIKGLQGTLQFDNVKVEHSAQNWARDPQCNNIKQGFTRGMYQIPVHWAPVVQPNGAQFESVYPAN